MNLRSTGFKGGLVVHLGCGDGQLTAALRANEATLVHGLALDENSLTAARKRIQDLGLYGPVSVELFEGSYLPYADNLVNLFVAEDLRGPSMSEVLRVLAPGGKACVQTGGKWVPTIKTRPDTIDEWTHALHAADNKSVSTDTVAGPPKHLQWVADPKYTRHHEMQASISVVVSAGGRLFYILDKAPTESAEIPGEWEVVARGAFNGILLWTRTIPRWESTERSKSGGPPELSRRLVAVGEKVYVTLGLGAPVSVLDAANGKTLQTYAGTEMAEEILCDSNVLYLLRSNVANDRAGTDESRNNLMYVAAKRGAGQAVKQTGKKPGTSSRDFFTGPKQVMALDAITGRVLWQQKGTETLPMSLAVSGSKVFWAEPKAIVCVKAETGAPLWRSERPLPANRPPWSSPTLVVHKDVIICADRRSDPGPDIDESTGKRIAAYLAVGSPGDLVAYSVADGKKLWSAKCAEGYCTPIDLMVNDGLVWRGQTRSRHGPDFNTGLDLVTGGIARQIPTDKAFETTMGHHRCYRNVATPRYILAGRTGVEFIDIKSGDLACHHWIRGVCQYGVVPANGLLYVPPHSCACYIEAKLTGFLALAPESRTPLASVSEQARLVKGPAFDSVQSTAKIPDNPQDWPLYRHDAARSGCASTGIPDHLAPIWQVPLGGHLTSPVVADGRVYLASINTYTLHALNARSGEKLWSFVAGARIDSPPAVIGGLVVFGSADGFVYCLQAETGALAWRYAVPPAVGRIIAEGMLESPWPVQGSVLVRDGAVYCAAGRSSFLDAGIRMLKLDLKSGRMLAQQTLYSPDSASGKQPAETQPYEMPGALPDILSSENELIYLRHLAFAPADLSRREAPAHLFSPAGFLDHDGWHRTYWIYGQHFYSGYIGWYFAGRETPAGRLLVMNKDSIYGFGYKPQYYAGSRHPKYHLFSVPRSKIPPQQPANYTRANRDYPQKSSGKFIVPFTWSNEVPVLVQSMVLAGESLFLAGPRAGDTESDRLNGKGQALLCAISARDGTTRGQYKLDSVPVHDGMAAARERLYLSLQNGKVVCFGDPKNQNSSDLRKVPTNR